MRAPLSILDLDITPVGIAQAVSLKPTQRFDLHAGRQGQPDEEADDIVPGQMEAGMQFLDRRRLEPASMSVVAQIVEQRAFPGDYSRRHNLFDH